MSNKNKVALTPPMGWNSYDYYDTTVTEEQVLANADYMAKHLKPFGWEYIIIDIQWSDSLAGSERDSYQYLPFGQFELDEYSRQIPAPNRFPSSRDGLGFKPIADYIHNLGLKFGIHIMRGIPRIAAQNHSQTICPNITADRIANPSSICKWNPDMYGVDYCKPGAQEYYDSIFELYAQWGVDFVKVDDICNTNIFTENPYSAEKEIEMIQKAIKKCNRPMVLSLSPGPAIIEKAWHMEKYANMWRITDDFWDNWDLLKNMFERCELWQKHVSEGCWPDCDMLPLGYIGKGFNQERYTSFTKDEQITMMTLWSIFRSPLMLGCELTKNDAWTHSLLTNAEVLYLLKNSYGATQVERTEHHAIWMSYDIASDDRYLALFNLSNEPCKLSIALTSLDIPVEISIRDLWLHTELGTVSIAIEADIPAHGAVMYKLTSSK